MRVDGSKWSVTKVACFLFSVVVAVHFFSVFLNGRGGRAQAAGSRRSLCCCSTIGRQCHSLRTHRRERQEVEEVGRKTRIFGKKVCVSLSLSLSGCCVRCLWSGSVLVLHGVLRVCVLVSVLTHSSLPPLWFGLSVSWSIISNPTP